MDQEEPRKSKKKKTHHVEIFPPTAPYNNESHVTIRSFADESLSEDDCEQEEISLLSKKHHTSDKDTITASEETRTQLEKEESVQPKGDQPYKRKPRKKTSKVWDYMEEIKGGAKVGSKCKLCAQVFLKSESSSTSAMKRHLEKCIKEHGGTLQTQLQFQRGSNDEVKLAAFQYDHALMREKISHYVMINEFPFMHVKSELDDYLSESIFILNESSAKKFDALSWWKGNSAKYPILSRMARDILAVPLSIVASEATFSAGSRVIEPHRSCLKTKTVEMLLCGADWSREIYGLKKSCQKKDLKPVEIILPV